MEQRCLNKKKEGAWALDDILDSGASPGLFASVLLFA